MGSFSADVTKFVQKTGLRADLLLRKLAFDALRGVIMKSPVDTGRFRGSWRIGINAADLSQVPDLSHRKAAGQPAIPSDTTTEEAQINKAKFGENIWLTNSVHYAGKLERGWSPQAPKGVLMLTFAEIRAGLERAVKSIP